MSAPLATEGAPPQGGSTSRALVSFSKENLQLALLRSGITPSDFSEVLPCHKATLYQFLKTGEARRLNTFAFERVYAFLLDGLEAKHLPVAGSGKAKERKAFVKHAFNHWQFNKQSWSGFKST